MAEQLALRRAEQRREAEIERDGAMPVVVLARRSEGLAHAGHHAEGQTAVVLIHLDAVGDP